MRHTVKCKSLSGSNATEAVCESGGAHVQTGPLGTAAPLNFDLGPGGLVLLLLLLACRRLLGLQGRLGEELQLVSHGLQLDRKRRSQDTSVLRSISVIASETCPRDQRWSPFKKVLKRTGIRQPPP